ncbi:Apoptotic protease-activating factor 1 [Eumeta japonica]|uniref:Apoptotic protease-activating factor 1 n=1 Tax=Eumeta variegata TaxID=151549 RepID=A0A4C1Z297_EUMVA|nr:Apoptotic protease-activating factor 1 [Eumeta japonica]
MDCGKRTLLQKYQNDIVKDLDVIFIIDELLSRQAISSEDYDYIQNDLKSRRDRTRYLLNVLIQKGNNKSYEVFVDSLSKDHSWLSDKFNVQEMTGPELNDSFEDILSRGDVPRIPEHYVRRTKQEKITENHLSNLGRHQILALLGMSGSGKSSLVIGVLRSNHSLVVDHFGGVVFWLNMGDVKTEDDIYVLQNRLHRKASALFRRESSYMNSSMSASSFASLDAQSLNSSEYASQDLKDTLKDDFLEPILKEALLVLDEVNNRRCVEAFDIGCKILVTARDTSTVSNFQAQIINNVDRELLVGIKEFLGTHGHDLFRYPCTDIVQSILQHVPDSILHMKADSIARSNSDRHLYFDFLHEQNVHEIKHTTIDVKDIVTAVCFLGDNVIVGTTDAIMIFHVYTNKLNKELPNTTGQIDWLATCPCNPLYLAAFSEQNVLQIWYIDDLNQENDDDTIEEGYNDRFLVMNKNSIIMHEWRIHGTHNNQNICKSKNVITSKEVKNNLSFLTAVVNRSGSLLFVSTDDSRIICIDLETNTYAFDLDNRRGNVVSMAVSEVSYDDFVLGPDVLLSGTGTVENSVKVWYLDTSFVAQAMQKHRKVRLTTKFDASFLNASLSPQTPSGQSTLTEPNAGSTPRRHQSFAHFQEIEKKTAKKTLSLDRHSLKPLNLKGISNGDDDTGLHPLLAIVDDKNNIQIMRGRKVLTEITTRTNDIITAVKISPCNHPVQYMNFVNAHLLVVFGLNKRLMAYKLPYEGDWKLVMLQAGNSQMGSQEILNDIQGVKKINVTINNHSDALSHADSETSTCSKDRLFPPTDNKKVCRESHLVQCFWVEGVGMLTVESNAMIKLWDQDLKLNKVLNARQMEVSVNCATYQNNHLAICDDFGSFQVFALKESTDGVISLHNLHERNVNNRIVSCDMTKDGYILAMGLDSGSVVRQLTVVCHAASICVTPTKREARSLARDAQPCAVIELAQKLGDIAAALRLYSETYADNLDHLRVRK